MSETIRISRLKTNTHERREAASLTLWAHNTKVGSSNLLHATELRSTS